MKAYAKIPGALQEREIVAVVDGEKLTFRDIYIGIKEFERIEKGLKNLEAMKII